MWLHKSDWLVGHSCPSQVTTPQAPLSQQSEAFTKMEQPSGFVWVVVIVACARPTPLSSNQWLQWPVCNSVDSYILENLQIIALSNCYSKHTHTRLHLNYVWFHQQHAAQQFSYIKMQPYTTFFMFHYYGKKNDSNNISDNDRCGIRDVLFNSAPCHHSVFLPSTALSPGSHLKCHPYYDYGVNGCNDLRLLNITHEH